MVTFNDDHVVLKELLLSKKVYFLRINRHLNLIIGYPISLN